MSKSISLDTYNLPYSGKLSREKTFMNFAFFSHPQKFPPRNSRHATPIMRPV